MKNYSKNYIADDRISWSAKGLLSVLLTFDSSEPITRNNIRKHSIECQTLVSRVLNELEYYGYIKKKAKIREKGPYEKTVYEIVE